MRACGVCTEDWGVRSVGKSLNYDSNEQDDER